MNPAESWNKVRSNLKKSQPQHAYATWFEPLVCIGLNDNSLILEVPNQFFFEWIQTHYKEAIQNEVARIPLPANIEKNGEYFGLKVQGDSMIEAGINEGDTVIVKKTDTADNGKIVVALIDDHEAMLKRIRRKGKTVALESANRNYETKIFGPDRVKVQGVLVSLYRNF